MKKNQSAFTMIELVFVIVILGILAAVAVPRFAVTRADAQVVKGRADVASIRAAIINERQGRLFRGDPQFIRENIMNTGGLFGGVLPYPITAGIGNGKWASGATAGQDFTYTILQTAVAFTYDEDDGSFTCAGTYCSKLAN
ncbi:prepilin-type N-terminal cleavage/methylation domain-containing protein [Sulfurimonas sp. MAG313]|nr:prepilin-type N-terminal cleavage/methylation domain-containing protein [Sulfurimonas sp. MAG313]